MSKIGSKNVIGQIFKPVITNATYNELLTFKNKNIPVDLHNGMIFSIPVNEEGNDIENNGSIWLTDSDGYLYCIGLPISLIEKANT